MRRRENRSLKTNVQRATAKTANLAAFAHFNMPLGNPDLPVNDALDVAAFVAAQPRPHFTAAK